MAKAVKLKDIAERAGVSVATVSMALSGKGKISAKVCDRIVSMAEELDYKKSRPEAARGKNNFRYVTILHSESYSYSWNFSYALISGLEIQLIKKGYYPLVIHMNQEWEPDTIIQEIRASKSGAVFSIDFSHESLFPMLEKFDIPLIVVNNSLFQDRYCSVLADDIQGSYEGAIKLIEKGHNRIAFLDYRRPTLPTVVRDRYFGFRKALDERGLPFPEERRLTVALEDPEELERGLSALFKGSKKPTAVMVHDDYFAACVISALRKLGLGVPYDVSMIAPGDVLDYSQPFLPRISTMRIDIELIVKTAVDLMMTCLTRRDSEVLVLKTRLHYMDRGSIREI
ncbi:MAG: LacI family DNA-binding transcriptional regulator [Rectinemataceae bacterium]